MVLAMLLFPFVSLQTLTSVWRVSWHGFSLVMTSPCCVETLLVASLASVLVGQSSLMENVEYLV